MVIERGKIKLSGFDYRKTAEEKWGKLDSKSKYKPDQKVISKLWQQHLWN